jgi:hypothetical protein
VCEPPARAHTHTHTHTHTHLQVGQKGPPNELLEIVSVKRPTDGEVVIHTKGGKAPITLLHESAEALDVWFAVVGAVARSRPQ